MIEPLADSVLLTFIDDHIPGSRMIEIEQRSRSECGPSERFACLIDGCDQGDHSIGDAWRRLRLNCPTREELGDLLLKALLGDQARYIEIQLKILGCRYCQSNLDDLQQLSSNDSHQSQQRQKYFQSSVGRLSTSGI